MFWAPCPARQLVRTKFRHTISRVAHTRSSLCLPSRVEVKAALSIPASRPTAPRLFSTQPVRFRSGATVLCDSRCTTRSASSEMTIEFSSEDEPPIRAPAASRCGRVIHLAGVVSSASQRIGIGRVRGVLGVGCCTHDVRACYTASVGGG